MNKRLQRAAEESVNSELKKFGAEDAKFKPKVVEVVGPVKARVIGSAATTISQTHSVTNQDVLSTNVSSINSPAVPINFRKSTGRKHLQELAAIDHSRAQQKLAILTQKEDKNLELIKSLPNLT